MSTNPGSNAFFNVSFLLLLLTILLQSSFATAQNSTTTPKTLNYTSIAPVNNASVLQCWSSVSPFAVSSEPGTIGAQTLSLGNFANGTLTIIPAGSNGGLHNAPAPQWVFFATGLIHITLPNSTDEAWLTGGRYALLFAADTAKLSKTGHYTTYPGKDEAYTFEIPTKDGEIPAHTVLHNGACTWPELAGL